MICWHTERQWKTLLGLRSGPNRATGPGSVGLVHTYSDLLFEVLPVLALFLSHQLFLTSVCYLWHLPWSSAQYAPSTLIHTHTHGVAVVKSHHTHTSARTHAVYIRQQCKFKLRCNSQGKFFKMAATESEIYFRFRFWWWHSFWKMEI